jgi:hypothetical protein
MTGWEISGRSPRIRKKLFFDIKTNWNSMGVYFGMQNDIRWFNNWYQVNFELLGWFVMDMNEHTVQREFCPSWHSSFMVAWQVPDRNCAYFHEHGLPAPELSCDLFPQEESWFQEKHPNLMGELLEVSGQERIVRSLCSSHIIENRNHIGRLISLYHRHQGDGRSE